MPRPDLLTPLFKSLTSMKGVGPQLGTLFAKFFGAPEGQDAVVLDVLMHMPSGVIDRRAQDGVAHAPVGAIATLKLHIDEHIVPPRNSRAPLRIKAHDETGEITLIFFGAKGGWVERQLPIGEERYVSGEVGFFGREKQMTHPDYIVATDKLSTLPMVEPVYPLTHGLSSKVLRKVIASGLDLVPIMPEWVSRDRRTIMNWPGFADALRHIHAPGRPSEGDIVSPSRMRLAYDEYLAGQLALSLIRETMTKTSGVARTMTGALTSKLETALPFAMTDGQRLAISDIEKDLAKPLRMSRLLQGDVGSGKTVVALMAMAMIAEDKGQSALMAPTELLASQHYKTLLPLAQAVGLEVVLMTGKMPAAERKAALAGLADGSIAIAVGTHALFQSGVDFHNLALTVVDEQHRFGVHQRLALSEKGHKTDLLVMTATPIPRTLVLTHFGDMDVSVLREKPAGRQPIDTAILPIGEYDRVIARLASRLDEGAQAYWVCPLVEESENLDVVAAEDRFADLKSTFGDRVELVHGRMRAADKQRAMARFQSGEAQVLVATTVIEVGVDVPNATIIIIEHAERFGLAQLHQLRGRVGRGSARSACLLLYSEPLSETAKARLDTIRQTDDGFEIAEKDLELRGQGDVLGTRQSGMPGYRIAVPDVHSHLLEMAHEDARAALERNPGLKGPDGDAMRALLYLFRKDLAIPLIKAG